ncbi:MAG: amidohydrolase family protein [Phycisphaeraceae bacterium]|nr:amidohydrolase family protein [Phycisphaeraceae bacterium]
MPEPPIYNCHIHTLTIKHVPHRKIPLLMPLLRFKPIRMAFLGLVSTLVFWDRRDQLRRFAQFVRTTYKKSQSEVFRIVVGRYPRRTRFVVLPMDMEFMGAGRPDDPLEAQLEELAELRDKYPEKVIPFVAVDPRRDRLIELVRTWIGQRGFKGIKIYPNLGYRPDDSRLDEVWAYAQEHAIPVMSHCSRGGIRMRGLKRALVGEFNGPLLHVPVLEKYPRLNLCLAHFGGEGDWEDFLRRDNDPDASPPLEDQDWLTQILHLIRQGKYPNLYTDISYTIFNFENYAPVLKVLLADGHVRDHVLFGSDYYMIEQERFEERFLSMRLRGVLGETLFWRIAHENPVRWLNASE